MGITKVSLKVIPCLELAFVPYLFFHAQFVVVFIITQIKGKNKKLGTIFENWLGCKFYFLDFGRESVHLGVF
jgi:hypothetical protein